MAQASYTKAPNYVSKKGTVTAGKSKVPFSQYKDVTKTPKQVSVPKNGFSGPGNINMAPKLKRSLKSKGFQSNYSK